MYHSRHRTDPYDKEILNALRDGKPRNFHQIPGEVTFSHNTLRLHLDSMIDDGLRIREKTPSKRRGRPVYAYHASAEAPTSAPWSSGGVIALEFSDLRRLCRHQRGVDAGRREADVNLITVPKSGKRIKHH